MRTANALLLQCSPCSSTQLLCSSKYWKNTTSTSTASLCSNCDGIIVRNNRGIGNQSHFRLPKLTFPLKSSLNQGAAGENLPMDPELQANSAEMSSKLAKLGPTALLAAVLAYGLFDAITYTTFFVLVLLGYDYEKSIGKNPAANLLLLSRIAIVMCTGNDITRPIRAAALLPPVGRGLEKIQNYLKFPNLVYAFALVASIIAASYLTIAGLLIRFIWRR